MPYRITDEVTNVDIRLNNGVYIMNAMSSTGKTRLAQIFDDYISKGYPVFSMSNKEINKGLVDIPEDKKVYLFDRFDLYRDKVLDSIYNLGKHAIVLVDTKLKQSFNYDNMCAIIMKGPNEIVVGGPKL